MWRCPPGPLSRRVSGSSPFVRCRRARRPCSGSRMLLTDRARAVPSGSCFLVAGWAGGHSSEALLCLHRIQFPSFHSDRTYFFLKFPLSSTCCYPHSSLVTPPRPGSPGAGGAHRAAASATAPTVQEHSQMAVLPRLCCICAVVPEDLRSLCCQA